jgi:hypothetical protein
MPTNLEIGALIFPLFVEPKSIKEEYMLNIVMANEDFTTEILKSNITGLHREVEPLYDLAVATPSLGVPDVAYLVPTYNEYEIEAAIRLENNLGPLRLNTLQDKPADPIFYAKEYLWDNYGYRDTTHLITTLPFIDSIGVVNAPPFSVANGWTVYLNDAAFNVDGISLDITYEIIDDAGIGTPYFEYGSYVIDTYPTGTDTLMVTYWVRGALDVLRFWSYDKILNTYPAINPYDTDTLGVLPSTYLPLIPIREFAHTLNPTDDPVEYALSDKLADMVNIDFEELVEQVDTNPDISDVYAAHLAFSVDVRSELPVVGKYLWEYFHNLIPYSDGERKYFESFWAFGPYELSPSAYFHLTQHDWDFAIQYQYIQEKIHVGTFALHKEIRDADGWYEADPEGFYAGQVSTKVKHSSVILRKQLTSNTYSEINVFRLSTVDRVDLSITDGQVYHYAHSDYFTGLPHQDLEIRLPVDIVAYNNFSNSSYDRDDLIINSLSVNIYAKQYTHVDWYKDSEFIAFVEGMALVITAFYAGPEIAALVAGALSGYHAALLLLKFALHTFLIHTAVNGILQFLIKEFGLEDTFWAVVAVVTVALVAKGTDISGLAYLPWADELLSASLVILSSFNVNTSIALYDVAKETTDFLESAEDRQEEIDKASELLGSSDLSFFDVIAGDPYFNPNEKPEDFFQRTIHNGNPGVRSLDMIGSYVDNIIRLPEANDPTNLII